MNRHVWPPLPNHADGPEVLHDQPVHAHGVECIDKGRKLWKFFVFVQCVDCNVNLHAKAVAEITDPFQFLIIKIRCIGPRAESPAAQVNGISTGIYRGFYTVKISTGSQQLRFPFVFHVGNYKMKFQYLCQFCMKQR